MEQGIDNKTVNPTQIPELNPNEIYASRSSKLVLLNSTGQGRTCLYNSLLGSTIDESCKPVFRRP